MHSNYKLYLTPELVLILFPVELPPALHAYPYIHIHIWGGQLQDLDQCLFCFIYMYTHMHTQNKEYLRKTVLNS